MLELNRAVAVRSSSGGRQGRAADPFWAQQTNVYNSNVSEVVELLTTYNRNVRYNLEASKTLEPPL